MAADDPPPAGVPAQKRIEKVPAVQGAGCSSGPSLPVLTLLGRIGWTVRLTEIVFDDPPYLVMQTTPVFPGCHDRLAERGIVWDVFALLASVRRPGAHQIVTSDCGYAPDSHLEEAILVSHPDENTVVWEFDVPGLRPALDDSFGLDQKGFVRLIFSRNEYEADIRAMVRELQHVASTPISIRALAEDLDNLGHLRSHYSELDLIRVDVLEPDGRGLAKDRLLELNSDEYWPREPMWPFGTLIEIGFFLRGDGHELIRVTGELARPHAWPGWHFTRWRVLNGFRAWLLGVRRAFALDSPHSLPPGVGKNEFVLQQESDRRPCHDAGRQFAAVMQTSLNEGESAPGVTVRYRECPLHAAETGALSAADDESG